jgi:putative polyketide hydroxylase
VLRGWGGEPLLESYERERRPVAAFNTQRSTRSDGSILGTAFGLAPDIGGRIAHAWVPRGEQLVSTLDLLADGLTLFVGPAWDGDVPNGDTGSPPMAVERLDALAARSLGVMASGSLLARPDGHPVALWNDESPDVGRLRRAVAAASGSPKPARRPRSDSIAPRSHIDAALATAVARGRIIRR